MHEPGTPPDGMVDLCEPFLASLPISGVAVSVMHRRRLEVSVAASDDVAARLDELQFDLSEGPQLDCVRTGRAVLIPDLDDGTGVQWPMFSAGAATLSARALFALPLTMGAATVGVVTLYRDRPGPLTDQQLSDAVTLAAAISGMAVDIALRAAIRDDDDETTRLPGIRREIHQATGMVVVQLGTTATEAFARLQARAFATGSTVSAVALRVLERQLDFADLNE